MPALRSVTPTDLGRGNFRRNGLVEDIRITAGMFLVLGSLNCGGESNPTHTTGGSGGATGSVSGGGGGSGGQGGSPEVSMCKTTPDGSKYRVRFDIEEQTIATVCPVVSDECPDVASSTLFLSAIIDKDNMHFVSLGGWGKNSPAGGVAFYPEESKSKTMTVLGIGQVKVELCDYEVVGEQCTWSAPFQGTVGSCNATFVFDKPMGVCGGGECTPLGE